MTLNEWIEKYEQRTGCKYESVEDKGFRRFFFPEYGFCEMAISPDKNMIMVYQLSGDGKFWRRCIEMLSMALGFKWAGTICIRRIKPYIRFWGMKIKKTTTLSDGSIQYEGHDDNGKHFRASPAWLNNETGEYAYYFTWEV